MTSVLAVLEEHRALLDEAAAAGARLGSLEDLGGRVALGRVRT